MALDVEPPAPPDLTNRGVPDRLAATRAMVSAGDLHREELEEVLRAGAWREAFREWAAYTDLTEEQYRRLREAGILAELDVYWDPDEQRLRSDTPTLPDDVVEDLPAALVRTELSDLGDAVVETVSEAYEDWGEASDVEPAWTEELFREDPTG